MATNDDTQPPKVGFLLRDFLAQLPLPPASIRRLPPDLQPRMVVFGPRTKVVLETPAEYLTRLERAQHSTSFDLAKQFLGLKP